MNQIRRRRINRNIILLAKTPSERVGDQIIVFGTAICIWAIGYKADSVTLEVIGFILGMIVGTVIKNKIQQKTEKTPEQILLWLKANHPNIFED